MQSTVGKKSDANHPTYNEKKKPVRNLFAEKVIGKFFGSGLKKQQTMKSPGPGLKSQATMRSNSSYATSIAQPAFKTQATIKVGANN